ncbi:MAG: hypothetical protein WBG43_03000 [Marinifilaceae bacterium]
MKINNSDIQALLKVILPEDLFDYFEITNVDITKTSIDVNLEELNILPEQYMGEKTMSKGFYPSIEVQDFLLENAQFIYI